MEFKLSSNNNNCYNNNSNLINNNKIKVNQAVLQTLLKEYKIYNLKNQLLTI